MRADIPAYIIEDLYRRYKERPFDVQIPLYIPTESPAHEPHEEEEHGPGDDVGDKYVVHF